MGNKRVGLIDNWIRHIKDVYRLHAAELDLIFDEKERLNRFVELNVMEQVLDLSKTSIVQNAWDNKRPLAIHGWVYDIKNGLIKDLDVNASDSTQLQDYYRLEAE